VVSAIGKGRHTSTSAVALRLPQVGRPRQEPGWIIDTPGVRSFGLAHVSADSLLHGFPDLVEGTVNCPSNCDHMGTAPARGDRAAIPAGRAGTTECCLDAWVAQGHADERRLASFRRLLASQTSADDADQTAT
jgi:ribosome biogenesis GTPase